MHNELLYQFNIINGQIDFTFAFVFDTSVNLDGELGKALCFIVFIVNMAEEVEKVKKSLIDALSFFYQKKKWQKNKKFFLLSFLDFVGIMLNL